MGSAASALMLTLLTLGHHCLSKLHPSQQREVSRPSSCLVGGSYRRYCTQKCHFASKTTHPVPLLDHLHCLEPIKRTEHHPSWCYACQYYGKGEPKCRPIVLFQGGPPGGPPHPGLSASPPSPLATSLRAWPWGHHLAATVLLTQTALDLVMFCTHGTLWILSSSFRVDTGFACLMR